MRSPENIFSVFLLCVCVLRFRGEEEGREVGKQGGPPDDKGYRKVGGLASDKSGTVQYRDLERDSRV